MLKMRMPFCFRLPSPERCAKFTLFCKVAGDTKGDMTGLAANFTTNPKRKIPMRTELLSSANPTTPPASPNSFCLARLVRFAAVSVAALGLLSTSRAADILWSSAAGSAWLTPANWTGGVTPGAADNAQFGANPTSGTTAVGINMATAGGLQQVGAIEVTAARTGSLNLPVNNSSGATAGTIQLNGATVNGVPNTVLRNAHAGTGTLLMGGGTLANGFTISFNNASSVIIDATKNITFSSNLVSAPNGFTKTGAGTLTMSVQNAFTGPVNINAGNYLVSVAQTNQNIITLSGSSLAHGTGSPGASKVVISGSGTLTNNSAGSARNCAYPVDLNGNLTITSAGATMTFATGAWTVQGASRQIITGVGSAGYTINSIIGDGGNGFGITKAGTNLLTLGGANTFSGPTTVNVGTLSLAAAGSIANSTEVGVAAGAKFDVSAQATYNLGSSATLKGSGTGTTIGTTAATIKGGTTVNVGTRPIVLTFTPTTFTGDTARPSLYLEAGNISLSGNAFTVTNAAATPLGVGTYRLIQQAAGSVTTSGSHTITVAGTGLAAATTASISVSGGNVDLVVASAVTATKIQPETAPDGSGTLVAAQTVNSGNSITVYAISRAADNTFVGNIAATWSLQNITGGVVSGNLVPSGDTKSAVFTGNASGTANIRSTSGILTATDSGTLTVACGTATTTNPSDQIALTGATATFSVSAGTSSSPTYQWQTNGGAGWASIGGATSASYTTPATTLAMNLLQYRCTVSVACDSSSATSTAATLYVSDPSNTSFRSAATGPWATPGTWQMSPNNGANWFTATVAPSDANNTNITVQSGHTVTSSGTASADDLWVVGTLTVSGGIFTVANGAAAVDANVTGTLEQTGGTLTTTGTLKIENAATFKWNATSAPVIPTATWADGSTCLIANSAASGTVNATGIDGQSYYDLTINSPATGTRTRMNLTGTATIIRRNFAITIPDVASASVTIGNGTGVILTVGGNVTFTTGTTVNSTKVLFNSASGHTLALKVAGNMTVTAGYIDGFGSSATTIEFNGASPQTLTLPSTSTFFLTSSVVSYQVNAGSSVTVANALPGAANLTLNGTLKLNGAVVFAGTTTVGSSGLFQINFNGGTIPTATWPAGSRVEVLGATTASPSAASLAQTLNDLTWDSAAQSQAINMTLTANMTVNGTLHLKNSNTREVRFVTSASPSISLGALYVQSGTLTASSGLGQPALSVTNGLTIDSGATFKAASGAAMPAISLVGGLTNNGTLNLALNRTNTPNATKLTGLPAVNQNGTLTISNNGPAPVNGDTFDLFDGAITGSFSTVNLPAGGAAHWNTSDLNVGGTVVFTNANPSANVFSLGVAVGGSATAQVMGKYATSPDADGDTVTITSVSTPSLGTAAIVGGTNITYTSTGGPGSDSFTYTVSDGIGGTDTKTVSVTISSPEGFNKLSGPVNNGNGTFTLDYLGIPGLNYALDESPDLVSPYTWFPVLTNAASGAGAISYTVPLSYPSGSFRTRYVP